jgi:hypothetical protein
MNRAWCLGFTLSSLAAMAPARPAWAEDGEAPKPAAADDAPPDRDEGPRPPEPGRRHTLLAVDAGYEAQSLFGLSMTGLTLGAILGVQQGDLAVGAIFEFGRGTTQEGLQTTNVDIGGIVEHRIDRLSLGGGVRVGTFDVSRITGTTPLLSTTAGIFARVSYDLLTFGQDDRSALYLLGKASLDSVDAPLWGAGLSLGVSF